ncbi:MAG: YqaE/Pmp3 family membrane protein [Bacteroidetes bacterium]|nr:YqaE/Pmp3 family membrane protein [Bacteroidota bacterium]
MTLKSGILGLIAVAVLASCSTGNDVVSGRSIQKRKYNDGYYFSFGNKFKNTAKAEETSFVPNDVAEIPANSENTAAVETETPALDQVTAEQMIPAGTTDNAISETATADDYTSTDKSHSRPLNVTKTEEKVTFKPGRQNPVRTVQPITSNSPSADLMLVLLVILCFIIPPLAVFIFEGASGRFWIDLILFIIGIAVVGWLLSGIAGLALLASVIYALLIVLSVI